MLIANEDLSLFELSFSYFRTFLDRPGGLLEYAGCFLNQFYRSRLAGALILGGMFLYHAWKLFDETATRQPIRTFVFSINYLMWLFGIMLVDHYIPLVIRLLD